MARQLNQLNEERRAIENEMSHQAVALGTKQDHMLAAILGQLRECHAPGIGKSLDDQ